MITLWGRLTSVNVQKPLFALEELAVPYQRVDAGGAFGIVDTPAYRAMNPNGLVPTLKDGEVVIWESNAIVRYLAARYGAGTLWPEDPAVRSRSDRWMDWQVGHLQPAVGPAFIQLVRTPPENRDAALVERSRQAADRLAGILDAALADSAFLGGTILGIGDIAVCPVIHRWLHLPLERTPRPHLQRWYEVIAARPSAASFATLPLA